MESVNLSIQQQMDYKRIADAIDYIKQHYMKQPSLDEIAEHVHLSPFHFHRLFAEWAGTTPKKFLQYISIGHAKKMLREEGANLFDAAYSTGLSGTSRLHDLFVNIEGMTPAEFKNEGRNLSINYSFAHTPFGRVLVASTKKGICQLAFAQDELSAYTELQRQFPLASFTEKQDLFQQEALAIFSKDWQDLRQVKLHLKATDFQLRVWEALLKVPMGQLTTYGHIAQVIQRPTASRAVGTAIGSNPVAFLIPCHRVIQHSGLLSGYRWGTTRKTALIAWEAAKAAGS
ncbi:methylated-DNA--[protein]-cysteine S-methyltransferase [Olivibacter sitiensis]|uniref:methylated-DNA--[protein]-cysteine S-methyltransferase n=1 Tax=Olivibacter sitiensis TaxID=376470 RepID=UPI000420B3AB|nr:methylated-DNA--[protein]-cysteine S-methyltransferase [Olivibacter sitiensis]